MGDKSNFHLVRWDKISAPLQSEGLAIRNLRRFNEELLGKWWWRFGNDQDVLWRRVIGEVWLHLGGWNGLPILFLAHMEGVS